MLNQAITDHAELTLSEAVAEAAKALPIEEQKKTEGFLINLKQLCETASDGLEVSLGGGAVAEATK